ncbi:carbohydrate binding domain-containing protein [uncultured Polaribacter sp.]|jgi:hypothetical protein|uniref:carbohydrate binding domain-containing protein n=1 Tax=uncultured Polaribacter sp. TaxID=174711 RepID=UPI0037045B9E
MKHIKTIYKAFIILIFISACTEDENLDFLENIAPPTNVEAIFKITQDNTGLVTVIPTAEGTVSFDVHFGDTTVEPAKLEQGTTVDHIYVEGSYEVTLIAYNSIGKTTEVLLPLVVSFQAPQNLVVTLENDAAVSKQLNITATAEFATTYEFYSGEASVTQPVAIANIGDVLNYQYAEAGVYDVKVIAKGGAVETTEYTEEFEVTEILAPIENAPSPSTRDAVDVISIFSDKYTDVADSDFNPNWNQSTIYSAFDLNGDAIIQYSNLNYQGIDIGSEIDASSMETLHIDIWTTDATSINIYPLPNGVVPSDERFVTKTLEADQWNSFDIPMSEFTDQGLTIDALKQFKFVGSGTVFIDNLYFYKTSSNGPAFDGGLLTNGDFENGSDSWLVGVDDTTSAPVETDGGNTYYTVDVTVAGNAYDVNLSQKVEIIEGNTYTLTFDAVSNVDRTILAGIGLSKDPWDNTAEPVSISSTITTYTVTHVATFGAPDARVLFDLGAEVGRVAIDNVSLIIGTGNIVTNGDFENGSDSWLEGVDDSTSAPVETVGGNTYYSVDVAAAGNAYDVNLSQKVEIIEGNTYTLTFDAWSNVDRSILAGIGLSKDPWDNTAEPVSISPTRTTYTLTHVATFGATDARVLFDLGAEIGTVNIDDVSLSAN